MQIDPRHEVEHVATQLAGGNAGFVMDFATSYPESTPEVREFIMGYYPRGFLPALHALAEEFTICDRWHASLPGPTWPNRFFALSGTSMGRVNMPDDGTHKADLPGYFQQTQDTIFDRLNDAGIHWKVYFHDIPQTTVFTNQRKPHNAARYFYIDEFFDDARALPSEFPQFSLIEPSYMGWGENDDHPPHDIMRAEKLIADVYNAIRANDALWRETLLIVVYDEHGGFYDHVSPPAAVPPDDHHEGYTFDRLGVRVPAILISPWVDRRVEHTLFDHTSILKYLIDKWHLGPLGRRTEGANSIAAAITLTTPRDAGLRRITLDASQTSPPDPTLDEKAVDQVNAHQTALALLSTFLKDEAVTDLPRAYAAMARTFEWLRSIAETACNWSVGGSSKVSMTIAEPDKLAHHRDAVPRDNVAHFLMRRKRQAVAELDRVMGDQASTGNQKKQALRTLGLISGRAYHREAAGAEQAMAWLKRHR